MIEYKIRDAETGEEHTGTAESVMLFADGIETTDGGPKHGTNMAAFFGRALGTVGMAESLKRSALHKDGVPFRGFISSVQGIINDRDFQKQSLILFLSDAMKAVGELAKMEGDTNE